MRLVADGLAEEELLDRHRRDRAQAGEQVQQLAEPVRLRRVLFVDVGVQQDLSLFLEVGDAVHVVQLWIGHRLAVAEHGFEEHETFQADEFVGVDVHVLEFDQ